MIKALIYKEWLKTRGPMLSALLLMAAMSAYVIAVVNRMITLQGVDHLWMIMLLKDNMFVDALAFIPPVCGIAVALAQALPEMAQKRFRLSLHLPCPNLALLGIMIGVGMAELAVIFAVPSVAVGVYYSTLLPVQLVGRALLTIVPWLCAGFIGYEFTFAAALELGWRRKLLLALTGAAAVSMCYLQSAPEAYAGVTVILVLFILVSVTLPVGSMLRFKEGLNR